MASGTVPFTDHRLRIEANLHAEFFGDAQQQVARHPQLITGFDAFARADLVLPLRGHGLGVSTADVNTRIEASLVVCFDDVTTECFTRTDTAIVRACSEQNMSMSRPAGTRVLSD